MNKSRWCSFPQECWPSQWLLAISSIHFEKIQLPIITTLHYYDYRVSDFYLCSPLMMFDLQQDFVLSTKKLFELFEPIFLELSCVQCFGLWSQVTSHHIWPPQKMTVLLYTPRWIHLLCTNFIQPFLRVIMLTRHSFFTSSDLNWQLTPQKTIGLLKSVK